MSAGKKGEEMREALQGVQAEVVALEKEEADLLAQLARAQASLSAARARKVSRMLTLWPSPQPPSQLARSL